MALGQHRQILQIVGYQNSGKTTVSKTLIRYLTAQALRVGAIKHHGHGGIPDAPVNKDSTQHEQAGAIISAVEGAGMLRLAMQAPNWSLAEVLALYEPYHLDVIIVEGYKQQHFPKVVLLRNDQDKTLLNLTSICCVLYWPGTTVTDLSIPHFALQDEESYCTFLLQEMRRLYDNV